MRRFYSFVGILTIAVMFMASTLAAQIQLGQVDDFNDGTTQGWQKGINDESALLMRADGGGALGKLIVFNRNLQWSGDYLAAGVTAIQMTVSNPSDQTLQMRLSLGTSPRPRNGETWLASIDAIEIAPNSEPQVITFPITESDLVLVQGSEAYETAMREIQTLRILHNPRPANRGVNIVASLVVDDITALGEPEVTTETFTATLTGRNEATPVTTLATGGVSAELTGTTLVVSGHFSGLSDSLATDIAGGAHIHLGYAGQNGGIELILNTTISEDQTSGQFEATNNTFELTEAQVMALKERQWYVNIHSKANRSGEIRGQLLAESDMAFGSNLFGSYEVPVVMTAAKGAALVEVRGTEMVLTGSFAGLEGDFAADIAGGAHIHLAMAGQNGGIVFPLVTTISEDLRSGIFEATNNTFQLTEEQLADLMARKLYINIHSQKSRSGEIRGQLISNDAKFVMRANLTGSEEVPIVTTTASGMVLAEVFDANEVQFSGSFNGLESNLAVNLAGGAHLHEGMAGMTGGIIVPIASNTDDFRTGAFPARSNRLRLEDGVIRRLLSRASYINVHSLINLSGELRGQLLPESAINFTGFLSGIFEVPEAATQALGAVKAELQGNNLTVSGAFNNLSSPLATDIAGGAHIHLGYAGETGGIQFLLNTALDSTGIAGRFIAAENTFTLTDEQVAQLRGRQLYINIHSQNIRSGELRSQFLFEANSYFVAPLSGTSETTPVDTDASGMIVVEVNGGNGFATGAFAGLEGDFAIDILGGAHIHTGLAGMNGPVRVILNSTTGEDNRSATFSAGSNGFAIEAGLLDTIRNRATYVNIHSEAVRSGEIRGQLLPLATTYFTTTLGGANEVPPVVSAASGAMKFEVTGNRLTLSGRFGDLAGSFDVTVNGGSHLHLAPNGENGSVDFILTPNLDDNLLGGSYAANDNIFELSDRELEALYSGSYYVNIHTRFSRRGELRGQILPEINRFPTGEIAIVAPADGTAITIEGEEETPFVPTWNAASDRDALAYIWQLAADAEFGTILFQTTVQDTFLNATYAIVDGLLEAAGVEVGQTVTLYHRAVASDGAVQTAGMGASVVLTRGIVGQIPGVDLELSITAPATYTQFTTTTFEIIVSNVGTEPASNIIIDAGRPEGFVHTSAIVTSGTYLVFGQKWEIPSLAAGESDTLSLTLFALIGAGEVTNFVQVADLDQEDVDSTPGNNDSLEPTEDDEAAVVLIPAFGLMGEPSFTVTTTSLYPTIANESVTLDINSDSSATTIIRILDTNGKLVTSQALQLVEGFNQTQLNVAGLSKGAYFVAIGTGKETLKFFKAE